MVEDSGQTRVNMAKRVNYGRKGVNNGQNESIMAMLANCGKNPRREQDQIITI